MKIALFEIHEEEKRVHFSRHLSEHELTFFENPLGENSLPQDTSFEAVSVFIGSKVSSQVMRSFPSLKFIAVRATGFDNIDLEYARSRQILVANVPEYGSNTVAEFTFGLILSLSRKIPQATLRVKMSSDFSLEGLRGFDLSTKTLGVVGTGKIGCNVAKIAKGLNMQVVATDPYPKEELAKTLGLHYCSLEELLKIADIITLHVPLTEQTRHLVNKNNIFLMKKGSLLINTSRGAIIETDALSRALTQGHLGGAALDVLEEEGELKEEAELLLQNQIPQRAFKNILENHVLMHLPNVLITPHMAFYTKEAEFSIMETTVRNIQGILSGTPQNLV